MYFICYNTYYEYSSIITQVITPIITIINIAMIKVEIQFIIFSIYPKLLIFNFIYKYIMLNPLLPLPNKDTFLNNQSIVILLWFWKKN